MINQGTSPAFRPLDHLTRCSAVDAPALLIGAQVIRYGAMDQQVGRLAAWLAQQVDGKGVRVATWSAKNRLTCLMPLAAARAGLVHVPINPLLKGAQARHILQDSGAALLIANAGRIAALADGQGGDAAGPDELGFDIAELKSLDAVMDGDGQGLPPSDARADDLAALLYTSGSTGRPKGVMLSHANLWLGAQSVAQYLKLSSDDRVLAVLPFSFDYGQNQLLSAFYAGASVAPLDYLAPRDIMKAVVRHDISILAGVPPLWVQLVEAEWPHDAAARLKCLTNSGGTLTPALIHAMRETFANADIVPMYGLTEAFRSTYLPPDLVAQHPTSMGLAIPHAEILVCRADGSLCDDDEVGELVHCGPLVAQGYWQDAARTAQRFRPAPSASQYGGVAVWSGDQVRRDAAGLLYFVGRDDAMIKTSGNRVSPTEVEEAAQSVATVLEAVAFGVPDDRLGAAIILMVRGKAGRGSAEDQAELLAHLRQTLPNFMQPQHIVWRDNLPRNPNGKLDRTQIASEWQA